MIKISKWTSIAFNKWKQLEICNCFNEHHCPPTYCNTTPYNRHRSHTVIKIWCLLESSFFTKILKKYDECLAVYKQFSSCCTNYVTVGCIPIVYIFFHSKFQKWNIISFTHFLFGFLIINCCEIIIYVYVNGELK